jgi:hypothetical protein
MVTEKIEKKVSKKTLNSKKANSEDLVKKDLDKQKKVVEKVEGEVISKKKQVDEEPTLFHYTIVLIVLGIIFGILFVGFEYYDEKTNDGAINNPNLNIKLYKYPFKVNGDDYSIQFYNPISDLEKSNLTIGITKDDLLNTQDFKFIFATDSSSNGEVVKVSGRLFPFLKNVYRFPLNSQLNIISSDNLTCENSSLDVKYIFFNSNSTTNEVVYDNLTGCITFKTTDPKLMGTLGDKFFLDIINQK